MLASRALPAILTGLSCLPLASSAQQRAIDFSELESTINAELKETGTPGAAVAVVVDGRLAFVKGFGVADVETGTGVDPTTLFRIASTTKMLTAAVLVTLADQGKVELDAPVGRYLPGLSPRISRVTLHQLLSHTSGIRDGHSFHGPHDDSALADFVRSWTDDYLIAEPGEIFSYSNLGYVLAGRVLEAVTDRLFADAMNETLFVPLGMGRTTLRPLMAMTHPLSQGHEIPAGRTDPAVVRPYADDARYWANGGVFTSVADFARFAIAFLNGGRIDGEPALRPTVIARMSAPQVDIPSGNAAERPQHGYGLNLRHLRGVQVLQHGGSRVGFGSLVRIVPEHGFAVIVLTNRSDGFLLRTFEKATEMAVPLQPIAEIPPRAPLAMDEAEMRSYAGIYQNAPDYLIVELVVDGGKLFLRQVGQSARIEVIKIGDHAFSAGGQEFLLIPGKSGKPRFMHIAAHALRRT